jgi:hypothetical protein
MRALIACEYSGTVRDAFRKLGWYALDYQRSARPEYDGWKIVEENGVLYGIRPVTT